MSRELVERLRNESQRIFPKHQRDGHAYHSTAHALDLAADALDRLSGGGEAWLGRNADLQRRRVVTLARLGLMLSKMAGGEAAEVIGYDAADLYAEVLMVLAIEDADNTDIALEIARDHPEGDTLAALSQPIARANDHISGAPQMVAPDAQRNILEQLQAVEDRAAETLWTGASLLKGLSVQLQHHFADAGKPIARANVPDGYVLVPREPTEAMLEAGADAIEKISAAMVAREASEHPEEMADYDAGDEAKAAWSAMTALLNTTEGQEG